MHVDDANTIAGTVEAEDAQELHILGREVSQKTENSQKVMLPHKNSRLVEEVVEKTKTKEKDHDSHKKCITAEGLVTKAKTEEKNV